MLFCAGWEAKVDPTAVTDGDCVAVDEAATDAAGSSSSVDHLWP